MREGHESRTAVLVCMGRAAAHGRTPVAKFDDPTALSLLPDDARARVEQYRSGDPPRGPFGHFMHRFIDHQSKLSVARTVTIDDAIRENAAPQVVVLGAGLDGRAWRMAELHDAVVFEVDHPDSQRSKRARAAALTPKARDIRFVPVDFTKDSLDTALRSAGHDATRPTTWIWEGVIMYLTPEDVEATLRIVAKRSARGSRLIALYHAFGVMLLPVAMAVRLLGEPVRSRYSSDAMHALLAKHGFRVVRDDDIPGLARSLSAQIAHDMRRMKHLRIVIADWSA